MQSEFGFNISIKKCRKSKFLNLSDDRPTEILRNMYSFENIGI